MHAYWAFSYVCLANKLCLLVHWKIRNSMYILGWCADLGSTMDPLAHKEENMCHWPFSNFVYSNFDVFLKWKEPWTYRRTFLLVLICSESMFLYLWIGGTIHLEVYYFPLKWKLSFLDSTCRWFWRVRWYKMTPRFHICQTHKQQQPTAGSSLSYP